jgi:hypothetical protein
MRTTFAWTKKKVICCLNNFKYSTMKHI